MSSTPTHTPMSATSLAALLAQPAGKLRGLVMLKTRYRPYICPLDWVLSEIPESARLYDIGCGSGVLLFLAHELRHARVTHGYDIDPAAVNASTVFNSGNPENWRVDCLKPEETPPSLNGYDTVTMIDVLHHIPPGQQHAFLSKLQTTMSPGARLIFKDIDASKFFGRWMNQLHDIVLARQWVHPKSRMETVAMLEKAGFRVLRHDTRWSLWYPHFLIVAERPR